VSVANAQKRLLSIAKSLADNKALPDIDRVFISEALIKIAQGDDAKAALNVKPKRGERVGKAHQDKLKRKIIAMSWIAAATSPLDEGGLGLSIEEAIGRIGDDCEYPADEKAFGLTAHTLSTYWSKNPELREAVFKIPD
jgi:hypothetical protein